jgi:dolichol kinase
MSETPVIAYKAELMRKAIHACSLSIPVIYFFISRELAVMILVPLAIVALTVDLTRYYHKPTGELFYKVFKWMLRSHELDENAKRLNGATNVLIAAALCVLIFPKLIFITAFTILIVSDSMAALIGRQWGRHKFFTKSFEGSLAFFLSAVAVVFIAATLQYASDEYGIAAQGYKIWIGIAGAALGTIVEALPWRVDDNLSIPFSVGATMWLLYSVSM